MMVPVQKWLADLCCRNITIKEVLSFRIVKIEKQRYLLLRYSDRGLKGIVVNRTWSLIKVHLNLRGQSLK